MRIVFFVGVKVVVVISLSEALFLVDHFALRRGIRSINPTYEILLDSNYIATIYTQID